MEKVVHFDEDVENMMLAAELRQKILIDRGNVVPNFKDKIKSGELDKAIER